MSFHLTHTVSILFLCLPLFSQDILPPIHHYTMKDGLSQMKTTSITQDKLGFIWIGTRSGLNRFDGKEITTYSIEDGLPHGRIHALGIDSTNNLVALTYKGLSFFDGQSFRNFPKDFQKAEYNLIIDALGRTWILGFQEIYVFEKGQYQKIDNLEVHTIVKDPINEGVFLICTDGIYSFSSGKTNQIVSGNFWYSKPNHIIVSDPYFFQRYSETGKAQYCQLKDGRQECFDSKLEYLQANPNTTFLTISGNSLLVHSYQDSTFFNESPFVRLVDVHRDNSDNLWLADENGFSSILNSPFDHFPYKSLPYVWTVNQDRHGHYWAASFGNGLKTSKNGSNFTAVKLKHDFVRFNYFLAASEKDNSDNLYFGHSEGILKWDGYDFENLLPGKPVYALEYDSVRNVMIAGGIFGVAYVSLTGNSIIYIDEKDGLHPNDYIQNISLDDQRRVWAGSYAGVSQLDINGKVIRNYSKAENNLLSDGIYCSFTDPYGTSWLGGSKGLFYYDEVKDSIIPVESSVVNSMVKSITSIRDSLLLIGAKDGLYLFNSLKYREQGQFSIQVLNSSNGYQGLEPGFTGFYTDNNENIWICSASSVDVFYPNQIKKSYPPLRPVITQINDLPLRFTDSSQSISLQRSIDNIKVRCHAVGATRPQNVKYKYQIDDLDWSNWTSSSEINISDLEHGSHELKVRVGPSDQPDNQSVLAKLEFSVDLPIYMRSYFPYIAYGSITLLLLITAILYAQQRLENKRYKSQLAASKYLRSQLLLSELNPHFIFNILSSIQHKVLLGDRDMAASYVVKLSKMIRNFLSASHQSHKSVDNYRENDITLSKELELLNSYLEFEVLKSDNHFQYDIQVSEEISPSRCFLPSMLIQPFVENAIKHGLLPSKSKGQLKIVIDYIGDDLKIVVEDNGIGRERASKINAGRTGHVSLGTLIIAERIALLNELGYSIKTHTEDAIPKGTKVTITLKE